MASDVYQALDKADLAEHFEPEAGERCADESGSATAVAGKLVLVVDDEDDVRFGTEALLRRWRCHTASAGSVEEVAAALERGVRALTPAEAPEPATA